MEDDRAYFASRAEEQKRAAAHAKDAETRRRHLELADLLRSRAAA
jgi:hypothetical protein